ASRANGTKTKGLFVHVSNPRTSRSALSSPSSVKTTDLACPTWFVIKPFLCSRSIASQPCDFQTRWSVQPPSRSRLGAKGNTVKSVECPIRGQCRGSNRITNSRVGRFYFGTLWVFDEPVRPDVNEPYRLETARNSLSGGDVNCLRRLQC